VANRTLSKLKRLQEQAVAFFHETGIGHEDDANRSRLHRFAHYWLLVLKSFLRNRCPLRASALAYTTLLALIPLLAVCASIMTGFLQKQGRKPIDEIVNGFVKNVAPMLNLQVRTNASGPVVTNRVTVQLQTNNAATTNQPPSESDVAEGPPNQMDEVVGKINKFIDNIQSGAIGITGTIALVFVAIGLLRTIEATFNDIWGVTRGRGWVESITQYFAALAGGPLILALVFGLTTGPQFDSTKHILGLTSFSEKRIKDFPQLATKLADESNPVSAYLKVHFDDELKNAFPTNSTAIKSLRDHQRRGGDGKRLTTDLVNNLNRIADDEAIYEEGRFSGVTLREKTRALVGKKLSGHDRIRFNRLLIEDAYAAELVPKRESVIGGFVFAILPFVVLSLAFALLYQLMPNTRVHPKAALVGGIVGGTLWLLNNRISFVYASKALGYSQIYGGLSIIPLFLVGMYFSWLILLFGAQVAYAFQNRQAYLQEKQAEGVSQRGREFVALRMMTLLAQHFQRGEGPPGVNLIASTLCVPSRLIGRLVHPLLQAKLIVEVVDRETAYVPARPLDQITAHDILTALRVGQGLELETRADDARARVSQKFESVYEAERETAQAVTLEALANGEPPPSVLDKVRLA
jgi:uncharacterized BrkB/YihY/UPF0761 family membrane protein/DNA-binding IscR family transcriptional regulator